MTTMMTTAGTTRIEDSTRNIGAVRRRVDRLARKLTPDQARAIERTVIPLTDEQMRNAIVAARERPERGVPRRHLSLEQTAVMVWIRHGTYYSREMISRIERRAVAKIRAAMDGDVPGRDAGRGHGEER